MTQPNRYRAVLPAVLLGLLSASPQRVVAQATGDKDWHEIREYVDYPKYQTSDQWTTLRKVLTGSDPVGLKRLGLAVHGHWVRTYVNQTAAAYLAEVKNKKNRPDPLVLPVGSCIVKENYRPQETAFEPMASPTVLTVMYKNSDQFHQTSLGSFNGKDGFLGGNWFYAFFFLPNEKWKAEGMNAVEESVQTNVTSFCIACHSPAFKTDYLRTVDDAFNPLAEPATKPYCDQVMQKLPVRERSALADVPAKYRDIGGKLAEYCKPSLSNELPADVPFDPSVVFEHYGSAATQRMFDCYAWKTFIALNWPAKSGQRGKPVANDANRFMQPRDAPTVWETYKPTYEVFQPSDPNWDPVNQNWNQPQPAIDCANSVVTTGELTLTMVSKIRDVVNETGQAFAGTFGYLVDQNGERVHYEVLFNKTEFDYLIKDGKAATKHLTPVGPKLGGQMLPIRFPDDRTDPQGIGAVEIKSAWKVLAVGPATKQVPYPDAASWDEAAKKFYLRELFVYDAETKQCSKKKLGLVGLHVAHKTHFAPQWIWMTFEHKDNVPEYGKASQASFFGPVDGGNSRADFIPPGPVPADCFNKPFLWFATPTVLKCPNVDINRFTFPDAANLVTRLDPIDAVAQQVNTEYEDLLEELGGSPFENYRLISTQWPLNGRGPDGKVAKLQCADNEIDKHKKCFTMVPPHLRNTSMESFMSTYCEQPDGKIGQFSNRSCMGCHGNAGSDFSYVYLDAVTQRVPIKKQ